MDIDYSDRKEIGRSGETISAIGLGTWNIRSRESMINAITHAVELGIDNIDTAEMYGDGRAEEIVGDAVRIVGRENIIITTKIMPDKFINIDRLRNAVVSSIRRLKVKYVDILLIHWLEPYLNIRDVVRMLESLLDDGYTRYIGVSNFGLGELSEALRCTAKADIVVNQVKYSVLDKGIEDGLLEFMIDNGITVQAYTPIERGRVVRDIRLRRLGEKYGKTAVQVALNYLISHQRVVAIPKTEVVERVGEFHGSMGWRLSIEDIEYLKRL